ncbi:hypothetical protein BOTBODRAFT_392704 [Botryobasidium botryosum FD-172 SS1]|uniref:Uncharacterized protein n=1 Tax=Botryobasidium botryosum (strain FD-172 SS1) TaxID=930990 RepID=A0A067MX21_BOTB1|nr:hypothetical protein BOTBODRAFT_392704 [Botryobasidium botryosum FD-172 SS1]
MAPPALAFLDNHRHPAELGEWSQSSHLVPAAACDDHASRVATRTHRNPTRRESPRLSKANGGRRRTHLRTQGRVISHYALSSKPSPLGCSQRDIHVLRPIPRLPRI